MDLLSYCTLNEPKHLEYSKDKPLNREPTPQELIKEYACQTDVKRELKYPILYEPSNHLSQPRFITPQDLSYDRNHGPIPHLRGEEHIVHVDGLVRTPISFSPDQLRNEFPQHEVTCALECAGNRRHTMRTLVKEVEGIDWGDAAVMNCRWKGPRIRDVLLRAGLREEAIGPHENTHVAFACYKVRCQEDYWFGSSVTLERCLREDGDAILALEVSLYFEWPE